MHYDHVASDVSICIECIALRMRPSDCLVLHALRTGHGPYKVEMR